MRMPPVSLLVGAAILGLYVYSTSPCMKRQKALAQRKSRGRVPGYTPSAYRSSGGRNDNLSDLYYEREALYPTQFDYEYNYTYPYASFPPYASSASGSLFAPSWMNPYYF